MDRSGAVRAAIVVTGSELVRGDRPDLNGPFLARSLLERGVEPSALRIVGDVPEEIEAALREGLERDLLITSGGLGPTHDDRTVELLARATGRPLHVNGELEAAIERRSRAVAERMNRPYTDFAQGVRKQATVPAGALVVGLVGTAPALVLELESCVVVVLPGPPSELRPLWARALDTGPVQAALARARAPERRILRFYGVSESAVASALERAGGDGEGVEVTICARDSEIHVDLFSAPEARERALELESRLLEPIATHLYATTDVPIEDLVLQLCRERGLTVATAESCTGGLVAARLTSVPGSSDVFVGGIVAYANAVKESLLGVPAGLIASHGAVSAEAASAMAHGARERLGADLAVSVTGIAGPGGGTPEKPVGLVHLCAAGPEGERCREFVVTGDRDTLRRRAAVGALHLLRALVTKP
jgi:competence/damage-inducible protein CinA-like protein